MTAEERNWGALAHAIPLGLNLITGLGWVASLIIYFAYKDKSRFVAHHAAQSLAMAALFFLLAIGGTIAFISLIGIPLAIVMWLVAAVGGLILPIVAAIKASNGEEYVVPVIGQATKSLTNT
ncbi:MAG: DUF4870 domain-containing protein [Armatimonadota bacterium]|jgi:uncharacterized membrane protein|nr:DUF4870 domain-containing protein [Fimbriimonadaceae bacterium]MCZ8139158.1 DUF4870 domain-containing protein [Fimbriimonadaceae bacterium]